MIIRKPIASLSLDLDNQWSYMKTHGDSGWESFPSYLDIVVPRVLSLLKELNLTITVFIVGQDAALAKNQMALRAVAEAGHEIGNHSFHHEPWLHLYSEQRVEDELARAEEHIERATGQRPRGFRGPGFSLSLATLRVLARRGYLYDASTFPTFLGPLARAYYFMTAKLSVEERRQRQALFGTLGEGLRPINPYLWQLETGGLIEIPVTTMPFFRVPIHMSYLIYLAVFSPAIAKLYFQIAFKTCLLTGTQLSLLLHPLDFLGCDDTRDLSFFPGMRLNSSQKLEIVAEVLNLLSSNFTVLTIEQHASEAIKGANLRKIKPRFSLDQVALVSSR